MIVRLLAPYGGLNAGDEAALDTSAATALIQAGFAVPLAEPKMERAVKKVKEKR